MIKTNKNIFLFIFVSFIFSFYSNNLFSFVRDFVESVKVIQVNSLKQKVINFNRVLLEGNVEVVVDQKLRLWADVVEIDKEQQFLIAEKRGCSAVVIENNDFLILADKFFLNLDEKTGYAKNIRIHTAEGYIIAGHAEKTNEKDWKMEDMIYTPCDFPTPHWSIEARKATLHKNYFVRVVGVMFKFGKVPFFVVPYMILPIQKRSKSGFLFPRFSYDEELGFGIREDFYWSLFTRCDTTVGVDWKEKKGIAFLDEFRWARSQEAFTLANSYFALEKNAFIKKNNRIVKGTKKRYWITGKDFWTFKDPTPLGKLNSLLNVDFGTDKKVGYIFFDNIKEIDDVFYNYLVLRSGRKRDLTNFVFDGKNSVRRKFLPFTDDQIKEILKVLPSDIDINEEDIFSKKIEIEDELTVCKIPHLEWNTIYKKLKKIFLYRHDIFLDWIFSRKRKREKFYINSEVVAQRDLINLDKADSVRLYYQAELQKSMKINGQIFNIYLHPNFQIRSNLKDSSVRARKNVLEGHLFSHGAWRIFLEGGAQWFLPETLFENEDYKYSYYFQPIFKWNFLPKFKQDHWYYSDKWDRSYPQNRLEIDIRNNWYIDNIQIDFNINQACDFYNCSDIYPLFRSTDQKNFLPLKVDLNLYCDVIGLFVSQEYDWKNFQLIQSQINFNFNLNKFNISLTTVYQIEKLQRERELFSDMPHFVLFEISVPLSKHAILSYGGQFYSEKDSKLFPFEGLRPLIHKIRLDYQGHCWGISLGFEEKRYREYGNWKSENFFTLFIRLESLGSFSRKFKKTPVYS